MNGEYDTGLGTTPGMWEMLSDTLDGEKVPEPMHRVIYALCEGRASVVRWVAFRERKPTKNDSTELLCCEPGLSPFVYNWYIDEDEYIADGAPFYWLDGVPSSPRKAT